MKGKYRIFVLGQVPRDLRERLSEIHASAILAQRKDDTPEYTKDLNKKK